MKGPESKIKDAAKKILTTSGAYFFMPAMGLYGRSGVPDIVACHKGNFLGIECKAGKGKTTALQDLELAAITIAGGVALIINENNLHELKVVLDALESL